MNKLIIASLALAPTLALAGAPKWPAAKVAAAVRKMPEAKGLKGVTAKDTTMRFLNGSVGTFQINAYRPNQGLPPTLYTVSGNYLNGSVSNVNVTLKPLQPRAMTK